MTTYTAVALRSAPFTPAQEAAMEYLRAEMVLEGSAAQRANARYYCRATSKFLLISLGELERLGQDLLSEYEENAIG